MSEPLDEALVTVEGGIRARQAIGEADVLALRRAIYARARVDRAAASLVLRLHRRVASRVTAWNELYVDVLMDFFFWDRDDGVIGESDAAWLVEQIRADGRVDGHSELELLLRVVFRAQQCPEQLRQLAREAMTASVVRNDAAPADEEGRRPGKIDRRAVEAIRRLVYGLGSDDGPHVGAEEAEWLIELDHATAADDNVPEWRELFVKALAMHLLDGGESPDTVAAAEARWLLARLDRGHGLTANGRALVAHLVGEARYVDPALEALAPRAPAVPTGPTFGRKGLARADAA